MSHSCEETYDVYEERRRVARKAHQCQACKGPVRPGDLYYAVSIVWEGRAETVKRCARCQLMHEHLRDLAPGEMWPDEKLNCGHDYRDQWECDPPEWLAALAFWVPGDPLPAREPCTVLPAYWNPKAMACRNGWSPTSECRRKPWPVNASPAHQEPCS